MSVLSVQKCHYVLCNFSHLLFQIFKLKFCGEQSCVVVLDFNIYPKIVQRVVEYPLSPLVVGMCSKSSFFTGEKVIIIFSKCFFVRFQDRKKSQKVFLNREFATILSSRNICWITFYFHRSLFYHIMRTALLTILDYCYCSLFLLL